MDSISLLSFSLPVARWRYTVLWQEGSKPELWNQQGRPLLGNDSTNTSIARLQKPKHIPVARQWLSKRHVTTATFTYATIGELLEAVFPVRSVPRLYNEEQLPGKQQLVGWLVELPLALASTFILGFRSRRNFWSRFLFLSPKHVRVWEMGPPFRQREGSVFQWRRYVCCTAVSARVYPRCHSVQAPVGTVHPLLLHYSK
jgi:hypothetical protein